MAVVAVAVRLSCASISSGSMTSSALRSMHAKSASVLSATGIILSVPPVSRAKPLIAAVRFLDEADEDQSSDRSYYDDCIDVMSIGCIGDTTGDSLLDRAAKLDTCSDVHVVNDARYMLTLDRSKRSSFKVVGSYSVTK